MSLNEPNADLDRSDRHDKWRTAAALLALALVVAIAWAMYSANTTSQNRAVSATSQRFTLAQQVAAACAVKETSGDLGGLCQSASQIIKEGPAGSPGLQGPPGDTGPQGPLGPKGERGFQGAQGAQGVQGVFGLTGPQGVFGVAGADGGQGVAGANGLDGTAGAPGSPGAPGASGLTGPAGPAGATGPAGADGLPGAVGATGLPGTDGQTPTVMTCVRDTTAGTAPGTFSCTVTAWRAP